MGNICSNTSEAPPPQRPSHARRPSTGLQLASHLFVQENQSAFLSVYKLHEKPLGSGAYGEVWLCTHLSTNETRAVKILLKEGMPAEEIENKSVFLEVEILKKLDHPNILKVYEYFEDDLRYYIVMEFCKNGDVFGKIEKNGCFNELLAAQVTRQLLSALVYLHSKGYIHRDIKSENLLLSDSDRSDEINIKLIDFNIATSKKADLETHGTLDYMAPEVFQGGYNEKCDVWGVGVVLYSLLSGIVPFGADDEDEIESNIKNKKVNFDHPNFRRTSKAAKDLIVKLLEKDPKKRPSAAQALNHEWILSYAHHAEDKAEMVRSIIKLGTYKKESDLKHIISTFIITQLSKTSQARKLEKVFHSVDKNKDGVISEEELLAALKMEMTESEAQEQVDKIMESVSLDEGGNINYTEFVRISAEEATLLSKENILKTFAFFDKDGSGSIDKEELVAWMRGGGIPDEIVSELISGADKNQDGTIDMEEFESILLTKLEVE